MDKKYHSELNFFDYFVETDQINERTLKLFKYGGPNDNSNIIGSFFYQLLEEEYLPVLQKNAEVFSKILNENYFYFDLIGFYNKTEKINVLNKSGIKFKVSPHSMSHPDFDESYQFFIDTRSHPNYYLNHIDRYLFHGTVVKNGINIFTSSKNNLDFNNKDKNPLIKTIINALEDNIAKDGSQVGRLFENKYFLDFFADINLSSANMSNVFQNDHNNILADVYLPYAYHKNPEKYQRYLNESANLLFRTICCPSVLNQLKSLPDDLSKMLENGLLYEQTNVTDSLSKKDKNGISNMEHFIHKIHETANVEAAKTLLLQAVIEENGINPVFVAYQKIFPEMQIKTMLKMQNSLEMKSDPFSDPEPNSSFLNVSKKDISNFIDSELLKTFISDDKVKLKTKVL